MTHAFLHDGHERACQALRKELLEKYADELGQASWWQRWKLHRRIERELREQLAKVAPRDALYSSRRK